MVALYVLKYVCILEYVCMYVCKDLNGAVCLVGVVVDGYGHLLVVALEQVHSRHRIKLCRRIQECMYVCTVCMYASM
jgi:hypothetical protein